VPQGKNIESSFLTHGVLSKYGLISLVFKEYGIVSGGLPLIQEIYPVIVEKVFNPMIFSYVPFLSVGDAFFVGFIGKTVASNTPIIDLLDVVEGWKVDNPYLNLLKGEKREVLGLVS